MSTWNNNIFDMGQDILNSVSDAVATGDFSNLSDTVKEKAEDVLNSGNTAAGSATPWRTGSSASGTARSTAGNSASGTARSTAGNSASGTARSTAGTSAGTYRTSASAGTRTTVQRQVSLYTTHPAGLTSGLLMEVCGGVLAVMNALFAITAASEVGVEIFFLICAALWMGLFYWGYQKRGRATRFIRYCDRLRLKGYCSLEELSALVSRKKDFVVKDIQQMINSHMFYQAHMDAEQTTVMLTDELYKQYLASQKQFEEQKKREAEKAKAEEALAKDTRQTQESRRVLEEGQAYLKQIREANAAIPGEEISRKLTHLENTMSRIFKEVERDPSLAGDLRKFINYYLPTTAKLVEAYRELDAQPVQGDNILKSKKDIEDTMDTINEAYEKILDGFFKERSQDISADITVMKSMLKQEGLTEGDFGK